jgi:hypothetical protein
MNTQSNENGNRLFVGSRFVFRIEKEGDNPVKTARVFFFFNHVTAWKVLKGLQSETY